MTSNCSGLNMHKMKIRHRLQRPLPGLELRGPEVKERLQAERPSETGLELYSSQVLMT